MKNTFFHKKLILDQYTPISVYQKIKSIFDNEITFLFESVLNGNDGNFSYIIIGQRERIWYKDKKSFYVNEDQITTQIDSNPFVFLKEYYKKIDKEFYKSKAQELELGFIDGFIGNIGYDMVCEFEPKLKSNMSNLKDEIDIPSIDLIRPSIIIGFSHKTSQLTLLTSCENKKNYLDIIEKELTKKYEYLPLKKIKTIDKGFFIHDKKTFINMVKKAKEFIRSGDVFQILLTNRFIQKLDIDNFSFYRSLRSKNPSPYLFFLEYENFCIAGSSPEVMIKLTDGAILLRPIAGTRKRGSTYSKDLLMEEELLADPKERAEHIMLVDLGRNDVGKVATTGSVKVSNLMRIEKYSHVMHIVTDVTAKLDKCYDMFDLFMATFTAGTMTGTPKIRAMELIAHFEKTKRSFYSGSIGYFGFDGNMDSAITIRTALMKDDKIIFQAGAGVVSDSNPELEYLEVKNKLAANMSVLKDLM